MKVDDENWHVLTVSRRDPETGEYTMERAPCYHLVAEEEQTTSSHASGQKLPA
jgi:adenylylsulfate reductase subunit A